MIKSIQLAYRAIEYEYTFKLKVVLPAVTTTSMPQRVAIFFPPKEFAYSSKILNGYN